MSTPENYKKLSSDRSRSVPKESSKDSQMTDTIPKPRKSRVVSGRALKRRNETKKSKRSDSGLEEDNEIIGWKVRRIHYTNKSKTKGYIIADKGVPGKPSRPLNFEIVRDDATVVMEIPLTNGTNRLMAFDEDLLDDIVSYAWHAATASKNYVCAVTPDGTIIYFHNKALGNSTSSRNGMTGDHINRHQLDNRRKNLRKINQSMQNANRPKAVRTAHIPEDEGFTRRNISCQIQRNSEKDRDVYYVFELNGIPDDIKEVFGKPVLNGRIYLKSVASSKVPEKIKLAEATMIKYKVFRKYPDIGINPDWGRDHTRITELRKSFNATLKKTSFSKELIRANLAPIEDSFDPIVMTKDEQWQLKKVMEYHAQGSKNIPEWIFEPNARKREEDSDKPSESNSNSDEEEELPAITSLNPKLSNDEKGALIRKICRQKNYKLHANNAIYIRGNSWGFKFTSHPTLAKNKSKGWTGCTQTTLEDDMKYKQYREMKSKLDKGIYDPPKADQATGFIRSDSAKNLPDGIEANDLPDRCRWKNPTGRGGGYFYFNRHPGAGKVMFVGSDTGKGVTPMEKLIQAQNTADDLEKAVKKGIQLEARKNNLI